jgi:2-hydroxy-3-keto-5-methylthiopentenyl-1-phosphate phosphatase
MHAVPQHNPPSKVLISDFDGTMTRRDFYQLAIQQLIPANTPDYWADYRAGRLTHFDALRHYFAAIRASEADVLAVVGQMGLDPQIGISAGRLAQAGWKLVVTSAGCRWYIQRLLGGLNTDIEIHANPGEFQQGQGLLMRMPTESRFVSTQLGIDKAAVVRHYISQGATVAFAGDGFPDVEPARLVPQNLRFARGDLADVLQQEGLAWQPFEVWSEIAESLLRMAI